jgi:hypothetical protein
MTVSLEMMAEAASTLMPGQKVIGARNVQASRWIQVDPDGEPVTVAFSVKRIAPDTVRVFGWRHRPEAANARGETLVEGVFLFGAEYPEPPRPSSLELVNGRTPEYEAARLYTDRKMFHGPSFQGIVSLDRIGENGILAKLDVLPTDTLVASDSDPVFHLDPCLLDAAGQLVGYWPLEYCTDGFVLFPIRVHELALYRGVLPPGSRTACQMRIASLTPKQLRADIDVIAPDGSLWMRITGWEDWRFSWTNEFYQFWRFPNRSTNGTPLNLTDPAGRVDVEARRIQGFGGEMDKPMWEYLWAHMILSRREMAEYRNLSDRTLRTGLLYRKGIVKDTLRAWLERRSGVQLYPADIEVDEEGGEITLSGPAMVKFPEPLRVSVSYDHPVAVAAAAPASVGIEVEAIAHWEGGVETLRMSRPERDMLPPVETAEDRDEWLTRSWCAKKVAAKALGMGISEVSAVAALAIDAVDHATGEFTISWKASTRDGGGSLRAATVREGDYIIALATTLETR